MFWYKVLDRETGEFKGILDKQYKETYIIFQKFKMIDFKQIKNPKARFYCPVNGVDGGYYGYGTAWTMMYKALENNQIQLDSQNNTQENIVFMFCPPHEFGNLFGRIKDKLFPGQKVIHFFDWECDNLAKQWVENINNYADISVCPTPFFKDIYKNAGIKNPILIWQHGVNKAFDKYKERKYTKGDDFYFFTYNAGEKRKGWDFILQAFFEEFENEHNVKLIAKNNNRICPGWFDLSLSKFDSDKRKDIIRIQELMSFDELIKLAHKSHCFLFPALGEGYALPVVEMMLTGLPCILTKAHRFLDLPGNTYLPVETETKQGRRLYNVGNWWEPKIDSLKKQMRFIYENYKECKEIGLNSYNYVKEKEDTDIFTKEFLKELLKEIDKTETKTIKLNYGTQTITQEIPNRDGTRRKTKHK